MQPRPAASSTIASAYTSSGCTAKRTPPIAGPTITAAWPAIERSAIALGSSSAETTSGGIDRPAGAPSAPATPVAAARPRNGHS